MILLQSFESFDILAQFDPDTGGINWLSKRDSGWETVRMSGHISRVAEGLWFLYRAPDGILHVRFDGRDFLLQGGVSIDWARGVTENVLSVVEDGATVFSKRYRDPHPFPPVELDPTPFVEEEDFDFGLFLRNVSQDEGRRERVYANS